MVIVVFMLGVVITLMAMPVIMIVAAKFGTQIQQFQIGCVHQLNGDRVRAQSVNSIAKAGCQRTADPENHIRRAQGAGV